MNRKGWVFLELTNGVQLFFIKNKNLKSAVCICILTIYSDMVQCEQPACISA